MVDLILSLEFPPTIPFLRQMEGHLVFCKGETCFPLNASFTWSINFDLFLMNRSNWANTLMNRKSVESQKEKYSRTGVQECMKE